MPVPTITIYQTRMIDVDLSEDGRTAVLTFKPQSAPPVSVQLSRAAFEAFLQRAAEAIKR